MVEVAVVEVAVKYEARSRLSIEAVPATESVVNGEVVPTPTLLLMEST